MSNVGKASRPKVTFEHLVRKVARAEDMLEMREQRLSSHYRSLGEAWRAGWTPGRIISVGLVSGFLVGKAEPLRALTGARALQMVGAISSLFATAQAKFAAEQAEEAADSAEAAVAEETMQDDQDEAGPEQASFGYVRPSARQTATPDEVFRTEPRPAEAATEISER
ncbi:MAG: protein sip-5 [Lysobacteraceae bacterium]|nr:MAG: protein sip-5 [Xanthomonadaceae bacterium]